MLTIKKWQTPCKGRVTRVFNQFDAFKCHGCKKNRHATQHNMVSCSLDDCVTLFCSGCWDEEDWICGDCHVKPDDSQVIGCERCGQWAHFGCQSEPIDNTIPFICGNCREQAEIPVVIPEMKVEIYDLNKSLKAAQNQLETKTSQICSLKSAQMKAIVDLKASETELRQQRVSAGKRLSEVHRHCANQIETLKVVQNSESQSKDQELVSLKLRAAQAIKERDDCRKANGLLRTNLQSEKNARIRIAAQLKESNKRGREMYENARAVESRVKKLCVRIPWHTSIPTALSKNRRLSSHVNARYKTLWKKYKCKWRKYYGDIQFKADLPMGEATYTSLNSLLADIQKL